MLKHRFNLRHTDAWEPFQKFVYCGAILKVLEKRTYWNTGPLEYPSPADLAWCLLHHWT